MRIAEARSSTRAGVVSRRRSSGAGLPAPQAEGQADPPTPAPGETPEQALRRVQWRKATLPARSTTSDCFAAVMKPLMTASKIVWPPNSVGPRYASIFAPAKLVTLIGAQSLGRRLYRPPQLAQSEPSHDVFGSLPTVKAVFQRQPTARKLRSYRGPTRKREHWQGEPSDRRVAERSNPLKRRSRSFL